MNWKVKKLDNFVGLGKEGIDRNENAGLDLRAAIEKLEVLQPGQQRVIPTGIACSIDPGWYLRVAPRSGLAASSGIDVLAGVVDSGYRGEIKVILLNTGHKVVQIERGERIAQLIPTFTGTESPEFVEDLDETERGAGGFGSTGTK